MPSAGGPEQGNCTITVHTRSTPMKVLMVQRTLFLLLTLIFGAHAIGEDAHFETYTAEDGQRYFTLSLQGQRQTESAPREVVIVVDTSASQAGYFRET